MGAAVCVGVQMSVCVPLPLFAKTIGHISQTQTDQAVGCPVSANRFEHDRVLQTPTKPDYSRSNRNRAENMPQPAPKGDGEGPR